MNLRTISEIIVIFKMNIRKLINSLKSFEKHSCFADFRNQSVSFETHENFVFFGVFKMCTFLRNQAKKCYDIIKKGRI